MNTNELIEELKDQALAALDAGDLEKAEAILKAAHTLCNDPERMKIIEKALDEVTLGSIEEAERILEIWGFLLRELNR